MKSYFWKIGRRKGIEGRTGSKVKGHTISFDTSPLSSILKNFLPNDAMAITKVKEAFHVTPYLGANLILKLKLSSQSDG